MTSWRSLLRVAEERLAYWTNLLYVKMWRTSTISCKTTNAPSYAAGITSTGGAKRGL